MFSIISVLVKCNVIFFVCYMGFGKIKRKVTLGLEISQLLLINNSLTDSYLFQALYRG